jgi:hypothetical protein
MAYLKEIYRSYRHVFCFAFAKVMAWFALRFWMIVTRLAECLVMWIEAYSNAEINTVLNKVFATSRLWPLYGYHGGFIQEKRVRRNSR